MKEIRHFGRLRAEVDHENQRVVLTLAKVKEPIFDPAKLERWARQSLAALDYQWERKF